MFNLIVEDTFYLKTITYGSGSFQGGVWIGGEDVITYTPILGLIDPYRKEDTSIIAPEGMSSDDMRILLTKDELKIHQSLETGSNLADVIYLIDPEVQESPEYTVFAKSIYDKNQGFQLIDSGCHEYLLVRSNRI